MHIVHFDVWCVYENISIDVGLNLVKHIVGKFDNHNTNFEILFVFMLTTTLPYNIDIVYFMYDKSTISHVVHMNLCRLLVHVVIEKESS